MHTDTYRRDDGWEVVVIHDGTLVESMSHLPTIVTGPPHPLTTEYAERALRAHGYVLATSPNKD